MTAIAVTAAQIAQVYPQQSEVYNVILAEAVTKGQVLYQTTTGTYGLCDTGEAAKDEPRGVALEKGAAGQVVSMLTRGALYGVTLSGEAYDGLVYASDTAGGMSDSAVAEIIGRVVALADNDKTKVLYLDIQSQNWN